MVKYSKNSQRSGHGGFLRSLAECGPLALFLTFILLCTACSCPCDKLVDAAEKFDQSVGEQYEAYVESDESLTEEQKFTKKLNRRTFQKAIKKFKKQ